MVAFCQCDWFTFLMRIKHRSITVQFVKKNLLQLELHANILIVFEAHVLTLET